MDVKDLAQAQPKISTGRSDPEPIALPAAPIDDHPHAWLVNLVKRRGMQGYSFRLAEYENPEQDDPGAGSPHSTKYEYTTFTGRQILDGAAWCFAALPRRDADVGLNSLVTAPNGSEFHVGMADFALDPDGPMPGFGKRLEDYLQWYGGGTTGHAYYRSGRSVHGYFDPAPAHEYMGRLASLLLANSKDASVVDGRWVAHKLIEGSAVLRWTANQRSYLAVPKAWHPTHYFWS